MTEEKRAIRSSVSKMIGRMSCDNPATKKDKAIWRHSFARPVCDDLKAWGLLQRDLPEELKGKYIEPSYGENAVYMAVAAFAACGAQADGVTLGESVAALGERQRDRFTRLENSANINTLWRNLKDILRLIASKHGKGLDYGLLACDIYDWQFDKIRTARKWERNYYNISEEETR